MTCPTCGNEISIEPCVFCWGRLEKRRLALLAVIAAVLACWVHWRVM